MTLRRTLTLALLLGVCLASLAWGADRASRAEALHRRAMQHIERNTPDTRRMAVDELEQATLLDPDRPDWELTLGRLYLQMRRYRMARLRFERVAARDPNEPAASYGLGMVWRHDWLKFLDRTSLDRACYHLSAAARLRPSMFDAWIALAPLLVETGELRAANAAAMRANEAGPGRYESMLAIASTAYRLGDVDRAQRYFVGSIPRLPAIVRARFDDIAPIATERDTSTLHRLPAAEQRAFLARFWKENDPDLATPENEAQLEYWSRVAQAYFLYYDPRRQEWDMRAEVYVRYGPPEQFAYNPYAWRLGLPFFTSMFYPSNIMVWNYPQLGMEVVLEDRSLTENYMLPRALTFDPDPRPSPLAEATRDNLLFMREGRGVFSALPPRVEALPFDGLISMFESDSGARMVTQLQTEAAPEESLTAEVVVIDSLAREVYRARRRLSPSACDPLESQVADFAATLPPGSYRAGVSVRDGRGRRGTSRQTLRVGRTRQDLALSELVVTCGLPPPAAPGQPPVVRLEPNPARRVDGRDPLTAYFEIYRLAPGDDGLARFEFEYIVRSAKDRRIWVQRVLSPREQIPPIVATREEQQAGGLRRQFVSVPVQTLPPGRYRLEVRVRDLVSADEARSTVEFTRADPLARAIGRPGPGTH